MPSLPPLIVVKFGGGALGAGASRLPQVVARISALSERARVLVVFSAPLVVQGDATVSLTDVALRLGARAAQGEAVDGAVLWRTYEALAERHLSPPLRAGCLEALGECRQRVALYLEEAARYRRFADTLRARLLAWSGEYAMTVLMQAVLSESGLDAERLPPEALPITTDRELAQAQFLWEESRQRMGPLREAVARHRVVVVPGFIGRTVEGEETTFERGGSDRSAVDYGLLLSDDHAVTVRFEKEAPVLSADPRVERRGLEHIRHLTLGEAYQAALFGMKLLDPLAVRDLDRVGRPLPLVIGHLEDPGAETHIGGESAAGPQNPLKIVVGKRDCALVRLEGAAAAHLLAALVREKQYREFIQLSNVQLAGADLARLLFLEAEFVRRNERYLRAYDPNAHFTYDRGAVTVIGEEMRRFPDSASVVCGAVAEARLPILSLDVQEETARLLIILPEAGDTQNVARAVRAIHAQRAHFARHLQGGAAR